MFTQMDAVCHRFEELSIRLNQPDTAADPALFRRLMREYHDAEPVVQAYRAWQTAQDHLAQAKALLEEPGALDPDFKQMIQQEISEKSQDVEKLENNLKILLLPKDVNDGKNVIVEIRGGAGGEEAALFAHSLLRMYTMYVQSRGWQLEMLNLNETELGGVKEAIFSVDGAGAYNRLKYESGVHRVQHEGLAAVDLDQAGQLRLLDRRVDRRVAVVLEHPEEPVQPDVDAGGLHHRGGVRLQADAASLDLGFDVTVGQQHDPDPSGHDRRFVGVSDAQARTSLRSPRSWYDSVSLPRRPCDARTQPPPNSKSLERDDTRRHR